MSEAFNHSAAFRMRRFMNWFPLGVAYACLYMGRYNLTVAKNSLGELMTKEDFGVIFGVGTVVYAFSFLFNGPFVDRVGGRLGMLIGVFGAAAANIAMALYLRHVLATASAADQPLRLVFCVLYGANMYFQSFGAVAIVKVNASWFHVRERGGFSGIFGTMISSGIFLAFTVNAWILDVAKSAWPEVKTQWVVFLAPALLLAAVGVVELLLLKDRPSLAGHADFNTGDASSDDDSATPIPARQLFARLLKNPIIMTVALVELCTGVLRNGVMQWFPIYAKEVWALDGKHALMQGEWSFVTLALAAGLGLALSAAVSRFVQGNVKRVLTSMIALAALAPFFVAGWGGLLFVAGVVGGNAAGFVSDLFFQSRRAPAAFGLYLLLAVCALVMIFTLSRPTATVQWAQDGSGLLANDVVKSVAGVDTNGWDDVAHAVSCVPPVCQDAHWDAAACICATHPDTAVDVVANPTPGTIAMVVVRAGQQQSINVKDPAPTQRAGDKRALKARPVLPLSPWVLGVVVFLMSLCVIGTHGLLSGTATMDFGGRKAAATAVGVIDGFVYLGTAVQSFSLGFLTGKDWAYWPMFLLPFACIGAALLTRIWHAKPTNT